MTSELHLCAVACVGPHPHAEIFFLKSGKRLRNHTAKIVLWPPYMGAHTCTSIHVHTCTQRGAGGREGEQFFL